MDIDIKPRLYSKSKLVFSENEYHSIMHRTNINPTHYMHYHDYYEIVFYLGVNNIIFMMKDMEYRLCKGDIVLCNIFEPHVFLCEQNDSYDRFSIGIDPKLLLSYSSIETNLVQIFDPNKKNYPVLHMELTSFNKYLELIMTYCNQNITYGKEVMEKGIIQQVLAYIYNDCYENISVDEIYSKRAKLISQLVLYVKNHLGEDITLDKLAKEVNYSVTYICKVFKEVTNETLIQYILEKRLGMVKHLLKSTMPITEVAERAGFNNYSYFYKAFKEHVGIGPKEYREQKQLYGKFL